MISKLKWCIRVHVGDAIHCITLLPINKWCRIGQHKCLCCWDLAIMERTLGIWPGSVCCQIPPATEILILMIPKSYMNSNINIYQEIWSPQIRGDRSITCSNISKNQVIRRISGK